MDIQTVKQRFGMISQSPKLDRAIDIAMQVAPTDLSVLITGESGSGKEFFPQIIHQQSTRKHGKYIAVNCGAIPEGTIDSELFGHEKGSFTGAHEARKGYFEVADGGTIFLDEVAELPLSTQVRLLRVLETGEFMKVGSSKVQKTNARIVAATNVNIPVAIENGKFRDDLYYRLNTVPIQIPSLRERKEDIHLLFRKFAADFSAKYRMPTIKLDEASQQLLVNFRWPGNVRQLKNVAEQISVIEQNREINVAILSKYLPDQKERHLPAITGNKDRSENDFSERELLYKVLFDMKKDITDLKKIVYEISNGNLNDSEQNSDIFRKLEREVISENKERAIQIHKAASSEYKHVDHEPVEVVEESLSLEDKEIDLIKKALEKHRGKRKSAAKELGISERTLYRKIKEYDINN